MIKEIAWYIARPKYYGEFLRKCKEFLTDILFAQKIERETLQAKQWCKENSLSFETTFSEIGQKIGSPIHLFFLSNISQKELTYAKQRVSYAQQQIKKKGLMIGGGSSINLLYSLSEGIAAEKIVETGVAYGWSSLAFLLSLKKRPRGRLWSIDKPYPGLDHEPFVGCAVPEGERKQWSLLRGPDRTLLPVVLTEAGIIDLCHYDSDKSYSARMLAYPKLWAGLRAGGIFISDDIGDNLAFKHFCEKLAEKPWIIEEGKERYLGILMKSN